MFSKLTAQNFPSIVEIFESHSMDTNFKNFGLDWSKPQIEEALGHLAYGIVDNGQTTSVLFARKIHESLYEIDMIMTHKKFLKKKQMFGLFSHFVNHLEKPFELWLEVHEKNFAAISFYKKKGFLQTSKRLGYYPDGFAALLLAFKSN